MGQDLNSYLGSGAPLLPGYNNEVSRAQWNAACQAATAAPIYRAVWATPEYKEWMTMVEEQGAAAAMRRAFGTVPAETAMHAVAPVPLVPEAERQLLERNDALAAKLVEITDKSLDLMRQCDSLKAELKELRKRVAQRDASLLRATGRKV